MVHAEGRAPIAGSSDPTFRGDPSRWNPEQLLVASVAACHKLWFLHLASEAGLVITDYIDHAEGVMIEDRAGGRFDHVTLRPEIRLRDGDPAQIAEINDAAHARCFIANSVAFPIRIEMTIA